MVPEEAKKPIKKVTNGQARITEVISGKLSETIWHRVSANSTGIYTVHCPMQNSCALWITSELWPLPGSRKQNGWAVAFSAELKWLWGIYRRIESWLRKRGWRPVPWHDQREAIYKPLESVPWGGRMPELEGEGTLEPTGSGRTQISQSWLWCSRWVSRQAGWCRRSRRTDSRLFSKRMEISCTLAVIEGGKSVCDAEWPLSSRSPQLLLERAWVGRVHTGEIVMWQLEAELKSKARQYTISDSGIIVYCHPLL